MFAPRLFAFAPKFMVTKSVFQKSVYQNVAPQNKANG